MSTAFVDPRIWQIGMLTALLTYGKLALGFPVTAEELLLIIAAALGTQWLAAKAGFASRFDPKSALTSALSIAILLRAAEPWLLAAASAFAIASKYALRIDGKHLWNPSALAIAAAVFVGGQAWLSPGQWGNTAWFAFAIAGLGGLIVFRAERSDVTWAFAAFWCALVVGRSLWIGEPFDVPMHRLKDGGLLLFTFFMISDPKTTPDTRTGRLVFAGLVAAVAFYIQFALFRTNGLLWALALVAPLVPVLDQLLPGARYRWARPDLGRLPFTRSPAHETSLFRVAGRWRSRLVDPYRARLLRFLRSQG